MSEGASEVSLSGSVSVGVSVSVGEVSVGGEVASVTGEVSGSPQVPTKQVVSSPPSGVVSSQAESRMTAQAVTQRRRVNEREGDDNGRKGDSPRISASGGRARHFARDTSVDVSEAVLGPQDELIPRAGTLWVCCLDSIPLPICRTRGAQSLKRWRVGSRSSCNLSKNISSKTELARWRKTASVRTEDRSCPQSTSW